MTNLRGLERRGWVEKRGDMGLYQITEAGRDAAAKVKAAPDPFPPIDHNT